MQLGCDTDRHFLYVFQRVLEGLVFLLEDLDGLLESLQDKDNVRLTCHSFDREFKNTRGQIRKENSILNVYLP